MLQTSRPELHIAAVGAGIRTVGPLPAPASVPQPPRSVSKGPESIPPSIRVRKERCAARSPSPPKLRRNPSFSRFARTRRRRSSARGRAHPRSEFRGVRRRGRPGRSYSVRWWRPGAAVRWWRPGAGGDHPPSRATTPRSPTLSSSNAVSRSTGTIPMLARVESAPKEWRLAGRRPRERRRGRRSDGRRPCGRVAERQEQRRLAGPGGQCVSRMPGVPEKPCWRAGMPMIELCPGTRERQRTDGSRARGPSRHHGPAPAAPGPIRSGALMPTHDAPAPGAVDRHVPPVAGGLVARVVPGHPRGPLSA